MYRKCGKYGCAGCTFSRNCYHRILSFTYFKERERTTRVRKPICSACNQTILRVLLADLTLANVMGHFTIQFWL